MAYVDRTVTGQAGKQSLASLLPGVWPGAAALDLYFPASNSGRVGIGDASMNALPVSALGAGEGYTYPEAAPPGFWPLNEIFLWFETAGDAARIVVRTRS